jgi:hypothetical protein
MTFQFMCPQGHLLEGDPSHAGQTCQCPQCNTMFLIPSPSGGAPADPNYAPVDQQAGPSPFDLSAGQAQGQYGAAVAEQEVLYHVPCPNGHELETPRDMFGQDVLCPHCNVQFTLRESDSVEYRRQRDAQLAARDAARAKLWLNWAIAIAILVGLALVGMIVVLSQPVG